jgi:hypothetical protein
VAAHGQFAWLPGRFNCRPGNFLRGHETLGRIAIVHFTGNVHAPTSGVAARMQTYMEQRILHGIARLPAELPEAERKRRCGIAESALDMIRATIAAYALDDLAAECHRQRACAEVD